MGIHDYKALTEQLETISHEPSDSANRRGYSEARAFIIDSDLPGDHQELVRKALHIGADTNQGFWYNSNGVEQAIEAIKSLEPANDDSFNPEPPKPITTTQLTDMVNNGRIFGVSFIRRTTGELRTMSCRLGVKKFLRGGKLSYSPAEKQLLTVFSMSDKGYRSIPLESIQRVSVGGQTFSVGA